MSQTYKHMSGQLSWLPMEVTFFFVAVKSFDANSAISVNFVLTTKNSIVIFVLAVSWEVKLEM